MYQEVVLSSTFIKFIDDEYKDFDFNSKCYKVLQKLKLEDKLIISQKIWANEVENYIIHSKRKDFLQTFIAHFVQNYKNIVKRDIKKQYFQKRDISNVILRNECNLALETEDKIIIRESLPLIKTLLYEQFDIEVVDFFSYTEPAFSSRILSEYKLNELKKDDDFDFIKFIKPYLENNKKIIIKDAYLIKKSAFKIFKEILSLIGRIDNEMNVEVRLCP